MPFPNVPNVPGVPPLIRGPGGLVGSTLTLMIGDAVSVLRSLIAPQWGLFQRGVPVIVADNVVSFEFKQDWSISEYPVERGGFESYNKVAQPFAARLRFSSGSMIARDLLLASIKTIAGTTELFDAVTADRVYFDVTITHYDFRRSARHGAGLLEVDVWCTEVRTSAVAAFSQTKAPSGAGTVDGGTVQPRDVGTGAGGDGSTGPLRITVRPVVVQ